MASIVWQFISFLGIFLICTSTVVVGFSLPPKNVLLLRKIKDSAALGQIIQRMVWIPSTNYMMGVSLGDLAPAGVYTCSMDGIWAEITVTGLENPQDIAVCDGHGAALPCGVFLMQKSVSNGVMALDSGGAVLESSGVKMHWNSLFGTWSRSLLRLFTLREPDADGSGWCDPSTQTGLVVSEWTGSALNPMQIICVAYLSPRGLTEKSSFLYVAFPTHFVKCEFLVDTNSFPNGNSCPNVVGDPLESSFTDSLDNLLVRFVSIQGIVSDDTHLYVTDSSRIRRVYFPVGVWTVAGNGNPGSMVEGRSFGTGLDPIAGLATKWSGDPSILFAMTTFQLVELKRITDTPSVSSTIETNCLCADDVPVESRRGMAYPCRVMVGKKSVLLLQTELSSNDKSILRWNVNAAGYGNASTVTDAQTFKTAELLADHAGFREILMISYDADNKPTSYVVAHRQDEKAFISEQIYGIDVSITTGYYLYLNGNGAPISYTHNAGDLYGPIFHDAFGSSHGWLWTDNGGTSDTSTGKIPGNPSSVTGSIWWQFFGREPTHCFSESAALTPSMSKSLSHSILSTSRSFSHTHPPTMTPSMTLTRTPPRTLTSSRSITVHTKSPSPSLFQSDSASLFPSQSISISTTHSAGHFTLSKSKKSISPSGSPTPSTTSTLTLAPTASWTGPMATSSLIESSTMTATVTLEATLTVSETVPLFVLSPAPAGKLCDVELDIVDVKNATDVQIRLGNGRVTLRSVGSPMNLSDLENTLHFHSDPNDDVFLGTKVQLLQQSGNSTLFQLRFPQRVDYVLLDPAWLQMQVMDSSVFFCPPFHHTVTVDVLIEALPPAGAKPIAVALTATTVTAMIAGAATIPSAAMDAQTLVILGDMHCSRPLEKRVSRYANRALGPLGLDDNSLMGVIVGNFALIFSLLLLQMAVSVYRQKMLLHSWTEAFSFARFPSFTHSLCFVLHQGISFSSWVIVIQSPKKERAVALPVAIFGIVFTLLYPLGSHFFVKKFIIYGKFLPYAQFHRQSAMNKFFLENSSSCDTFKKFFLPTGAWCPPLVRRLLGSMISKFRESQEYFDFFLMTNLNITCFIAALAPETEKGCQTQIGFLIAAFVLTAIFIMWKRPYRSPFLNVLASISPLSLAFVSIGSLSKSSDAMLTITRTGAIIQLILTAVRIVYFGWLNAMEMTRWSKYREALDASVDPDKLVELQIFAPEKLFPAEESLLRSAGQIMSKSPKDVSKFMQLEEKRKQDELTRRFMGDGGNPEKKKKKSVRKWGKSNVFQEIDDDESIAADPWDNVIEKVDPSTFLEVETPLSSLSRKKLSDEILSQPDVTRRQQDSNLDALLGISVALNLQSPRQQPPTSSGKLFSHPIDDQL